MKQQTRCSEAEHEAVLPGQKPVKLLDDSSTGHLCSKLICWNKSQTAAEVESTSRRDPVEEKKVASKKIRLFDIQQQPLLKYHPSRDVEGINNTRWLPRTSWSLFPVKVWVHSVSVRCFISTSTTPLSRQLTILFRQAAHFSIL